MVDHFSDLPYVYLKRSTIQKGDLRVKSPFDIQDSAFGVKIEIYHADNGIFSEKPFKLEIGYANQNITFCGVGYHHQNAIVERKLKL